MGNLGAETEEDANFSQRRERFLRKVGSEMEPKSDQKSARECFSQALWKLGGQDRGERELFCGLWTVSEENWVQDGPQN